MRGHFSHGNKNDQSSGQRRCCSGVRVGVGREKRKLEALLSSRLREAVQHRKRGRSLEEIMDEISQRAQERGLTQEKLDEILNEE